MPLIDEDPPEVVPRLKADLIAWLEERGEDSQGTVETLRLRMNEFKRKKAGEEKEKGAPAVTESITTAGPAVASSIEKEIFKGVTGRDPPAHLSWGNPTALFDPYSWPLLLARSPVSIEDITDGFGIRGPKGEQLFRLFTQLGLSTFAASKALGSLEEIIVIHVGQIWPTRTQQNM
jgi:hypothetical protein